MGIKRQLMQCPWCKEWGTMTDFTWFHPAPGTYVTCYRHKPPGCGYLFAPGILPDYCKPWVEGAKGAS